MKKVIYSVLVITLFIFSSSCNKWDKINNETESSNNIENGNYDPSFDWKTSRIVEFNISSTSDIIINITSVDNEIRYHRGMHFGENQLYRVKLSVPNVVKQLKINNKTLDIDSKIINYKLS